MPIIRVSLSIGLSGCTQRDEIEINEDEWAECETEEQRDNLIHEYWKEWADNYIDGGTEIIE